MIIQQGTTSKMSLPLKDLFAAEQLKNIIAIEVVIGTANQQIKFHWYSYDFTKTNLAFDKNTQTLNFTISPEQSHQWRYQVPVQVRIKDKNNTINNSQVFYAYIQAALSAEDF